MNVFPPLRRGLGGRCGFSQLPLYLWLPQPGREGPRRALEAGGGLLQTLS